jgi:hypothetical protein
MFAMHLAEAIVISVLAQPVMRILSAEAAPVAITMVSIALAEAVVIGLLAQPMPRVPIAEAHQGDQLGAQRVPGMPATELIIVGEPQPAVRAVPTVGVEQRPRRSGGRRSDDDPGACGRRDQYQDAEHDAGQQHPADQSKSSHSSPHG